MNSVSLPAPCVLAPAAVPAVESSELHGNDKVFPAGRKVCLRFQHKLMLPPNYGGGIMVNALGLGSSPCSGHCVLFLGKVLTCNFHSASLHPVPGLTL